MPGAAVHHSLSPIQRPATSIIRSGHGSPPRTAAAGGYPPHPHVAASTPSQTCVGVVHRRPRPSVSSQARDGAAEATHPICIGC